MIDWIKPNGREIRTNEKPENIQYAEANGWKRKEDVMREQIRKEIEAEKAAIDPEVETEIKPKRKRRTKEEMAADKLDNQNQ